MMNDGPGAWLQYRFQAMWQNGCQVGAIGGVIGHCAEIDGNLI